MKKKLLFTSLYLFLFIGILSSHTVSAEYYDYSNYDPFFGVMCFVYIIFIIIWLIVGIWGYKDAEKRGKNGVLWFLVIFFLGLIGLIIWLVVRPPIGGEKRLDSNRYCPNCGRNIPTDARICPYCGKECL